MKEREVKPPKGLSKQAGVWWKKILNEYEIDDEAGFIILQTALEAFDRMKEAQRIITKQGLTITDRFGQIRAHPLCTVERDARSQFLLSIKALNLDLEPIGEIGRPSGRQYPRGE